MKHKYSTMPPVRTKVFVKKLVAEIPRCVGHQKVNLGNSMNIKTLFDTAIFAALKERGLLQRRKGLSSFRNGRFKCKEHLWNLKYTSSKNFHNDLVVSFRDENFNKENNYTKVYYEKKPKFFFKNFFSCFS